MEIICTIILMISSTCLDLFSDVPSLKHKVSAKWQFYASLPVAAAVPFLMRPLGMMFPQFASLMFFFNISVIFLPFVVFVKGPMPVKIYLFASQIVMVNFFLITASIIAEIAVGHKTSAYFIVDTAIVLCFELTFVLLALRFGRKFCDMLFSDATGRYWYFFAFMPVSCVFCIKGLYFYGVTMFPHSLLASPALLALIVFIAIAFSMLPMYIVAARRQNQALFEMKIARGVVQANHDYYQKLAQISNELHILRHDSKYHLNTLVKLAESGDIGAAKAYFQSVDENYAERNVEKYCDIGAINALIDAFSERCKQQDVKLGVEINLPDDLSIDDYEMCIVLGNLLENAIFATCKLPNPERYIDLVIRPKGTQLGIMVENSFDGLVLESDGNLVSAKDGGGLGISSIKAILKQYKGEYVPVWEGKVFHAYILLSMKVSRK